MKFKMEIELGNDAMCTLEDVGRVIIEVGRTMILGRGQGIECLENVGVTHRLRDSNGNTVGFWKFEQ